MQKQQERYYSDKLASIETKFRLICHHYAKVAQETAAKDDIIQSLNHKIQSLERQLHQSKRTITMLSNSASKQHAETNQYAQKSNQLIGCGYSQMKFNQQMEQLFKNNATTPEQTIQTDESTRRENKQLFLDPNNQINKLQLNQLAEAISSLKLSAKSPLQWQIINSSAELKDLTNQKTRQQQTGKALKGAGIRTVLKNSTQDKSLQALHQIWQQRDRQILKMDQLFDNLHSRLKQYE